MHLTHVVDLLYTQIWEHFLSRLRDHHHLHTLEDLSNPCLRASQYLRQGLILIAGSVLLLILQTFLPLFQAQSSGTMSNLQQHNITGIHSRIDDDDDDDNDEDDNGDEEESEDNQRHDDEAQVCHERNTNRRIPFRRRLLP